jgi:hypothetical protein
MTSVQDGSRTVALLAAVRTGLLIGGVAP